MKDRGKGIKLADRIQKLVNINMFHSFKNVEENRNLKKEKWEIQKKDILEMKNKVTTLDEINNKLD